VHRQPGPLEHYFNQGIHVAMCGEISHRQELADPIRLVYQGVSGLVGTQGATGKVAPNDRMHKSGGVLP
jgi:hypothetical protein